MSHLFGNTKIKTLVMIDHWRDGFLPFGPVFWKKKISFMSIIITHWIIESFFCWHFFSKKFYVIWEHFYVTLTGPRFSRQFPNGFKLFIRLSCAYRIFALHFLVGGPRFDFHAQFIDQRWCSPNTYLSIRWLCGNHIWLPCWGSLVL